MSGWILLRNEKYEIESNEKPVDLIIPDLNIMVRNTILNSGVSLWGSVNIYGAIIEKNVKIATFVEIRKTVIIGSNTKIEPFTFIPEGVKIGKYVFVGPNVCFTNDRYPEACNPDGTLKTAYEITPTFVEDFVSIGAGSVIICGVTIKKNALIGAGSVVTNDVSENTIVYGQKAEFRKLR